MEYIRHGDILLTRVDSLPQGEEINHNGTYILAYGETTGHKHLLTATKESLGVRKANGVVFLSLTIPAPLTHEEHKTVEIPSGVWRMTFEREYDYALESMRQVVD